MKGFHCLSSGFGAYGELMDGWKWESEEGRSIQSTSKWLEGVGRGEVMGSYFQAAAFKMG